MKRLLAMIVGVALAAGTTGAVLAQGQVPGPTGAKKPVARNASGTVKTAAPDSLVVSARGKDAEWTFVLGPRTKIRKAGKDIAATDLAAGDAVHVSYHAEGGKNVADAVVVQALKKAAQPPKRDGAKK